MSVDTQRVVERELLEMAADAERQWPDRHAGAVALLRALLTERDAVEQKLADERTVREAAEQAEMRYHKDCVAAEERVATLEARVRELEAELRRERQMADIIERDLERRSGA